MGAIGDSVVVSAMDNRQFFNSSQRDSDGKR